MELLLSNIGGNRFYENKDLKLIFLCCIMFQTFPEDHIFFFSYHDVLVACLIRCSFTESVLDWAVWADVGSPLEYKYKPRERSLDKMVTKSSARLWCNPLDLSVLVLIMRKFHFCSYWQLSVEVKTHNFFQKKLNLYALVF